MNRCSTFAVIGDVRLSGVSNEKALDAVVPELVRLGVESVVVCSAGGAVRIVALDTGKVFHKVVAAAFAACTPPVEVVRLGGNAFVLCNVKEMPANGAEILENAGLRKNERFFYFQRKHPRGTCAGDFVAEQDGGVSTRVLSAYPNAVVFSPGAKAPLTDERSIRQGDFGFTAVQVSSFHTPTPFGGRENALPFGKTPDNYADDRQMPLVTEVSPHTRPAVIVSVNGEGCILSRVSLSRGKKLGEDWVLRLDGDKVFDYAVRSKKAAIPSFAASSRLAFSMGRGKTMKGAQADQLTVSFPKTSNARAHDYLVTAYYLKDGIDIVVAERRVYSQGILGPEDDEPKQVRCVFAKSELFQDVRLRFEARAMNAFGGMSEPLAGYYNVPAGFKWKG
ncbi:MAG: hypothetical protein J6R18_08200 [Kiritimatiellae bacterium]|nr:hypothetical protein [Kiritimatiellia bacterium]